MGISTHVLDTALGRPASGVPVTLSRLSEDNWYILYVTATGSDGRVQSLLPESDKIMTGTYRILFDTAEYFMQHRITGLYPYIEVIFEVRDAAQHYHIPLLIAPNGYTTYRGS